MWALGESHGLVVKAEDSWPRGVGSNPGTVYWMDVSGASYCIHENNENKGSQMGHTKKKILKKTLWALNINNKAMKPLIKWIQIDVMQTITRVQI